MIQTNFERGFYRALALWHGGWTWEAITHHESYDASEVGRGMFAAVEMLAGWIDIAELEARAWGYSREAARNLIAEGVRHG